MTKQPIGMEEFHQRELFTSRYRNNWFYNQIKKSCPNKICMDIGAGTGILSLFAIHNGAEHVYMIEHNPKCVSILKKIFKHANIPSTKYTVMYDEFDSNFEFDKHVDVVISETVSSNIFREDYVDVCKHVQNIPALKSAIMIPDSVYGSLMFFDDISTFDKIKDSRTPEIITTGVSEIDEKYVFTDDLLENYREDHWGSKYHSYRPWRPDANPLYRELMDDARNSACFIMSNVITFTSYNPHVHLEWEEMCSLPNKQYGVMLIARLSCEKLQSVKHPMSLDAWATYFYKFEKTSDVINIKFDQDINNFIIC